MVALDLRRHDSRRNRTASADGGPTGQPCPPLVVSGNDVSGGCLVEDMTGWMTLVGAGYCPVTFDIRIEADTDFYAVDPVANCNYPWTSRQACTDDANPTEVRPWLGTRSPRGLYVCMEHNGTTTAPDFRSPSSPR